MHEDVSSPGTPVPPMSPHANGDVDGLHLEEVDGRGFRKLLAAGRPFVVQFGSPTCEPCGALEPSMARLAAKYRDRIRIVLVDVDKQPDLGTRYNIWALPTVMQFHAGIHRRIRARNPGGLDAAMRALLADASAAPPTDDPAAPVRAERGGPGLLSIDSLHPSLTPFGRDIENVGIPNCLSEDAFCLEGLVYRIGTDVAVGLRVGCGQIITNRHVFEQLAGDRQSGSFLGRRILPSRPELMGRAVPPALPGGSLVMPWYVGRYGDWALLEETEASVCAEPRFRAAKSLQRDEPLWIVGGSNGARDFVTVGFLSYVKGVNGMLRDCDVQPGMSGSPVIDADGKVVGIFSTKFGWPGRRAMFVTAECIAQDIEALRSRDSNLPQIEIEAAGREPPARAS